MISMVSLSSLQIFLSVLTKSVKYAAEIVELRNFEKFEIQELCLSSRKISVSTMRKLELFGFVNVFDPLYTYLFLDIIINN